MRRRDLTTRNGSGATPAGRGIPHAGGREQWTGVAAVPNCYRFCMIVVASSLNLDLVGRVPCLRGRGETVLGVGLARHAGGRGGNRLAPPA